ncbi:hypothetical protein [uncultured Amnibacterium sp.]|uniref:hypothetical protein n=1 Tax=uncultured Amnibacterium sp. TaxID=1631851 RepID=UPI0035CB65AE
MPHPDVNTRCATAAAAKHSGRHHLVLAREEEDATTGGLHRDPEAETDDGKDPTS